MTAVERAAVLWWAMATSPETHESWHQVSEWAFGAAQYAIEMGEAGDAENFRFLAGLANERAEVKKGRLGSLLHSP